MCGGWMDIGLPGKKRVRESTGTSVNGDKEKFEFFAPHFKGKLLRDITSDFVQGVVEKQKGHRAEASRNRYYALVRAIMRRAHMR